MDSACVSVHILSCTLSHLPSNWSQINNLTLQSVVSNYIAVNMFILPKYKNQRLKWCLGKKRKIELLFVHVVSYLSRSYASLSPQSLGLNPRAVQRSTPLLIIAPVSHGYIIWSSPVPDTIQPVQVAVKQDSVASHSHAKVNRHLNWNSQSCCRYDTLEFLSMKHRFLPRRGWRHPTSWERCRLGTPRFREAETWRAAHCWWYQYRLRRSSGTRITWTLSSDTLSLYSGKLFVHLFLL